MTPERWQQIKEVLASALETPAAEREKCLARNCGGDAELRREVELLLEREAALASEFLDPKGLAQIAADVLPDDENPWIGRRVGAYQITNQIGVGGMGEVYRAFRADDQYRKEVALKLIRGGQDSALVIKRFRNERQILAGLEHPNIARLLDGGTTDAATPYLVMELIEGWPIIEYCEAQQLSVPERLKLFLQVCAAVQYAHQHLIIHRDIKPSNILVTSDGTAKLLDFGIAKILDPQNEPNQAERTLTMFRALTPQYASPEQIKGESITTATDVYSLGVVLYELLTGQSPYGNIGTTSEQAIHAICVSEPPKPSTAVRPRKLDDARRIAEKLVRQLRGDLDNIVLMALRKESQRRYSSVEQFAEDIRRSLQNLPIVARKDTARYRTSKFIARHKAAVAATAAVVLILVTGIVVTTQQARIAKRRFNDVRSLANSLIFDVHDSVRDLPGSTPARKLIVDRALQYLNVLSQESAGDLGLQRELAAAYERVGSVQGDYLENNLGDAKATLASYNKALHLRKQVESASKDWNDRLALAQGYRLVAHQLWANGDPAAARGPIERAIEISELINGQHPDNPKVLDELAFDHEVSGRIGFPGDASARQRTIQEYRRALAVDEMALKLSPNDIRKLHNRSIGLNSVATLLEATDPAEALKSYEKGLDIDLKVTKLSTEVRYRRSVAIDYGSIASVYDDLGDYPHALENNKKDLAIYQELVQSDPKNALLRQGLAIAYVNAASSALRAGDIGLATDYSDRGLETMRNLVSVAPEKAFQRGIFAAMLVARGTIFTAANKLDAAFTQIENARTIYQSLYGAGSISQANVAACDVKMGEAAAKARRDPSAAEYFQRALKIAEPLIASQPPDLDALYAEADAYSGMGDISARRARVRGLPSAQRRATWTQAQSFYSESLNMWGRIEHPNHTAPNSFQVGDPATVAKELKTAEEALASLRAVPHPANGGRVRRLQ